MSNKLEGALFKLDKSSSTPQYQPLEINRSLGHTVYGNQLVLGAQNKNKYELLMLEEITDGEQEKLIIMDRKEMNHRPSAIVEVATDKWEQAAKREREVKGLIDKLMA